MPTLRKRRCKIIQNLAGKRLDPETVAALMAVYGRGEIRIQRLSIKRAVAADPPRMLRRGCRARTALPASLNATNLERTRV